MYVRQPTDRSDVLSSDDGAGRDDGARHFADADTPSAPQ
jgi:hypothetical protein